MAYAYGMGGAIAGVPVTSDLCPDQSATSDAKGVIRLAFTRSVPYSLLFGHPGAPPSYAPQFAALLSNTTTFLLGAPGSGPPIDEDKVTVAIAVHFDSARPAPCNSPSGLRATVPSVPTAKTHYFASEVEVTDPDDPRIDGITIDGLEADVDVAVAAEKPGCRIEINPGSAFTKKVRPHRKYWSFVFVDIFEPVGDGGAADAGDGGG